MEKFNKTVLVMQLLDRPQISRPKADFQMRLMVDFLEDEFSARKIETTREELSEMATSFFEEKYG